MTQMTPMITHLTMTVVSIPDLLDLVVAQGRDKDVNDILNSGRTREAASVAKRGLSRPSSPFPLRIMMAPLMSGPITDL